MSKKNAKKLLSRAKPDYVVTFGKHKGKTLDAIAEEDPSYIVWLADNDILHIDSTLLDNARRDDMESVSLHAEWYARYD